MLYTVKLPQRLMTKQLSRVQVSVRSDILRIIGLNGKNIPKYLFCEGTRKGVIDANVTVLIYGPPGEKAYDKYQAIIGPLNQMQQADITRFPEPSKSGIVKVVFTVDNRPGELTFQTKKTGTQINPVCIYNGREYRLHEVSLEALVQ